MIRLLLLGILVVALVICLNFVFKSHSIGCAFPEGRLGDIKQNFYTLQDGRDVGAICTEKGWTADVTRH